MDPTCCEHCGGKKKLCFNLYYCPNCEEKTETAATVKGYDPTDGAVFELDLNGKIVEYTWKDIRMAHSYGMGLLEYLEEKEKAEWMMKL